jgi:tripartite-type tricarboxylate transporter receptor subunit TctC
VEGQGVDVVASSPAEFAAFLDRQTVQWGRIVRERDIRAD